MTPTLYSTFDDTMKKTCIALDVLKRLEDLKIVEHPCRDYSSAKDLSSLLVSLDTENNIQLIEIYSTFIRVYRTEQTGFRFGAVIHDIIKNPRYRQNV